MSKDNIIIYPKTSFKADIENQSEMKIVTEFKVIFSGFIYGPYNVDDALLKAKELKEDNDIKAIYLCDSEHKLT